jgi:hypothetical protein
MGGEIKMYVTIVYYHDIEVLFGVITQHIVQLQIAAFDGITKSEFLEEGMNMIRNLLNMSNFKLNPYIHIDKLVLTQQIWNWLTIAEQKFYCGRKLSCCDRDGFFFEKVLRTSSELFHKEVTIDLIKAASDGLRILAIQLFVVVLFIDVS